MLYQCNYCNHNFKNQSSLNYHIKTAKYCLKLRNQPITKNNIFNCIYCKKEFEYKNSMNRHIKICKRKESYYLDNNIHKLEEQKNIYENKLEAQKKMYESKLDKQIKMYENIEKKYENQLKEQKESYEKQIRELQNKLENIALRLADKPTTQNNTNTTNNQYINL